MTMVTRELAQSFAALSATAMKYFNTLRGKAFVFLRNICETEHTLKSQRVINTSSEVGILYMEVNG